MKHAGRNIGDPKARRRRRLAPRLECVVCGLKVCLSWDAYQARIDSGNTGPFFCFQHEDHRR